MWLVAEPHTNSVLFLLTAGHTAWKSRIICELPASLCVGVCVSVCVWALYPGGSLPQRNIEGERHDEQVEQQSCFIAVVHIVESSEMLCVSVCERECMHVWVMLFHSVLFERVMQKTCTALLKYTSFWCNQATTSGKPMERMQWVALANHGVESGRGYFLLYPLSTDYKLGRYCIEPSEPSSIYTR